MASRKAEAEHPARAPSPLPEDELAALLRLLRWARGFVLAFVRSNVPVESRQIVADLAERLAVDGPRVRELRLAAAADDLLAEIRTLAPVTGEAVVVVGFEHSIPSRIEYPPALDRLNRSREHFRELPCPLVLILPDYALNQLAREAPDFWAWRSGVFTTRPAVSRASIEPRELDSYPYELWNLSLKRKRDHLEVMQELLADLERSAEGNEADRSNLCLRIAFLHYNLGEFDDALLYARKALEYAADDQLSRALALRQIANVYRSRGDVSEALRNYEQALVIQREIGDRRGEGSDLGNLGNAYADLGEVEKAIGYYEQALVIAREIGDRRGEGNQLGNLGNAYARLGEVEKALGYYEQALVIQREIGDRRGEGNALGNLGNAYADLGDVEKAIGYHEQALVIAREIGDRRGEGSDLGNLGLAYARLGEVEKAIGLLEQALRIGQESKDPRMVGIASAQLEKLRGSSAS